MSDMETTVSTDNFYIIFYLSRSLKLSTNWTMS